MESRGQGTFFERFFSSLSRRGKCGDREKAFREGETRMCPRLMEPLVLFGVSVVTRYTSSLGPGLFLPGKWRGSMQSCFLGGLGTYLFKYTSNIFSLLEKMP